MPGNHQYTAILKSKKLWLSQWHPQRTLWHTQYTHVPGCTRLIPSPFHAPRWKGPDSCGSRLHWGCRVCPQCSAPPPPPPGAHPAYSAMANHPFLWIVSHCAAIEHYRNSTQAHTTQSQGDKLGAPKDLHCNVAIYRHTRQANQIQYRDPKDSQLSSINHSFHTNSSLLAVQWTDS